MAGKAPFKSISYGEEISKIQFTIVQDFFLTLNDESRLPQPSFTMKLGRYFVIMTMKNQISFECISIKKK